MQGLRANLTLTGPILTDNRYANLLILRRAPTVLEMRGAEVFGGLLAPPTVATCAAAAAVGLQHPKPLPNSPPMGASYAMLSTIYGSAFSRGMCRYTDRARYHFLFFVYLVARTFAQTRTRHIVVVAVSSMSTLSPQSHRSLLNSHRYRVFGMGRRPGPRPHGWPHHCQPNRIFGLCRWRPSCCWLQWRTIHAGHRSKPSRCPPPNVLFIHHPRRPGLWCAPPCAPQHTVAVCVFTAHCL